MCNPIEVTELTATLSDDEVTLFAAHSIPSTADTSLIEQLLQLWTRLGMHDAVDHLAEELSQ